MKQVHILKVVVASPGDVQAERDTLEKVVAELNRGIAADRDLRLELARWETDTYPGFHVDGPQGLIDPILKIEDCDILIGIFWGRFGTPTKDAQSGTEYEIRTAYQAWKKKQHPHIMVYFNQSPYTPRSSEETEQWGRVLKFKEDFPREGLYWEYKAGEFEDLVRKHLTQHIRFQYALPDHASKKMSGSKTQNAMLDTNVSFYPIWRFLKERGKLIILSALLFTGIYIYVIQFFGQSFGLFYYHKPAWIPSIANTEYTIYTGTEAGIYNAIGEVAANYTHSGNSFVNALFNPITLKREVEGSSGGYENAFGLTQKEIYRDNNLGDELNYISPLYLARMHIIYRRALGDTIQYKISNDTDPRTLRFFANSNISLGPLNSGTHIISRYVINELNSQIVRKEDSTLMLIQQIASSISDISFIGAPEIKNNISTLLFAFNESSAYVLP